MNEDLISNDYRLQNKLCHEKDPGYGSNGARWAPLVIEKTAELRNTIIGKCRLLDYGCGQNLLWRELSTNWPDEFAHIKFTSYDPAIPKYSQMPQGTYDYVICTDVLEHVEPEKLNNVIDHVIRFAQYGVFFNMPYRLGNRTLPDGSPCHKTVENSIWWMRRIHERLNCCRINWRMVLLPPGDVAWDVNIWCESN